MRRSCGGQFLRADGILGIAAKEWLLCGIDIAVLEKCRDEAATVFVGEIWAGGRWRFWGLELWPQHDIAYQGRFGGGPTSLEAISCGFLTL